jgi:hypothetical protein
MLFLTRLLFAGGAALAVLFAVLTLGCLCGSRLGRDLTTLRELRDTFDRELTRGREMDDEYRFVEDRLVRRHRIVQDLIAGRMGLREAAARYRDIDRERLGPAEGADDEERYCRQLIDLVKWEAAKDPRPW